MTPEPKPSKLALALRRKFSSPAEAVLALGLDPILLAQDKKTARDADLDRAAAEREKERRGLAERQAQEDHEATEQAHSEMLVAILKLLDGKIEPALWTKVANIVEGKADASPEQPDAKDSRRKFASDSRGSSFEQRWPEVSRIKIMS